MNPSRHITDIQSLSNSLRRQQFLNAGLVVISLLLTAQALTKETTVILEPPVRAKSIAVVGDRIDAAWLEEMGAWVAHMTLDASPHSIAWQQDQLLRWTHPSTHGQLQQEMAVQAKRLIDTNASTVFWLQQVAPDPERQRVAVVGQLDTYVNGVRVDGSSKTVSYAAQFESRGGRMLLKDWKPVPGDDLWFARLQEKLERDKEAQAKEKARANK